jgi:hypothetical protein
VHTSAPDIVCQCHALRGQPHVHPGSRAFQERIARERGQMVPWTPGVRLGWRELPPTPKQATLLRRWGWRVPATRGEASDLIGTRLGDRRERTLARGVTLQPAAGAMSGRRQGTGYGMAATAKGAGATRFMRQTRPAPAPVPRRRPRYGLGFVLGLPFFFIYGAVLASSGHFAVSPSESVMLILMGLTAWCFFGSWFAACTRKRTVLGVFALAGVTTLGMLLCIVPHWPWQPSSPVALAQPAPAAVAAPVAQAAPPALAPAAPATIDTPAPPAEIPPVAQPAAVAPAQPAATGYGEISKVTGQPRTSYVSGYTRKDGTYVHPYYRSHR